MELNAGYSTLLFTDTDIPYLFVGVYGGIGEKRKCKMLVRLGFQGLGKVFGGFQDSALDSDRGLYKRSRARTPKSSCPIFYL